MEILEDIGKNEMSQHTNGHSSHRHSFDKCGSFRLRGSNMQYSAFKQVGSFRNLTSLQREHSNSSFSSKYSTVTNLQLKSDPAYFKTAPSLF
jgi:hypothetical protein